MNTVDKIASVLAGVAVVSIIFYASNSPAVFNSVFGGTANVFSVLTHQGSTSTGISIGT